MLTEIARVLVACVRQARKELGDKSLASYFQEKAKLERFSEAFRIRLLSSMYDLEQVIGGLATTTSQKEATDVAYVQTLSSLYLSGDRDARLGNQLAIKFLERSIEQPIEYMTGETLIRNKFYFELFLKSFKDRILNEGSFEILKTLAYLIRKKENYVFFLANFGFEFFYELVIENQVFVDDLSPAKSLSIMIDTILSNAKQDEVRSLVSMFFSSEVQDKIEFFANFLSDFISLILVAAKLGKNQDIMPAMAAHKLYLVDS